MLSSIRSLPSECSSRLALFYARPSDPRDWGDFACTRMRPCESGVGERAWCSLAFHSIRFGSPNVPSPASRGSMQRTHNSSDRPFRVSRAIPDFSFDHGAIHPAT